MCLVLLTVLSKYIMTSSNNLTFLINNVKGLQSSRKRTKLIEYFRSKLNHNGFLFLQETHPTIKNENTWVSDFNGPVFFFHGTSTSCGVLIDYLGKTFFVLNKRKTDKAERILILDVMLDGGHYILINVYNANTDTEQCKNFNELQSLLNFFDINQNKRIIFADDFNILFSSKVEARSGKPIPKRKSITNLVDIKKRLNICDIWRIRNPKRQSFTFRQNHSTRFIERQLEYIFVSNCL